MVPGGLTYDEDVLHVVRLVPDLDRLRGETPAHTPVTRRVEDRCCRAFFDALIVPGCLLFSGGGAENRSTISLVYVPNQHISFAAKNRTLQVGPKHVLRHEVLRPNLLDMDMMAFPPGLSTLRISLNTWGGSARRSR